MRDRISRCSPKPEEGKKKKEPMLTVARSDHKRRGKGKKKSQAPQSSCPEDKGKGGGGFSPN